MIAIRVRHGSHVVRETVVSILPVTIEIEPIPDCPTLEIPASSWRPRDERRCGVGAFLVSLALGVAGILAGTVLETSFWSPWNHARSVGLVRTAITSALALPLVAGGLFLVLKVIGRRVRMADTMRALGRLAWLAPALGIASLAGYYPLSPSQYALFEGVLVALVAAVGVAVLASVRREPGSLAFTSGWAGAVLLVIAGLATLGRANDRQRGAPSVDLGLQAPLAGYAGRAETLDDYLRAIRSAAPSDEGGRELPAPGSDEAKAATLQ